MQKLVTRTLAGLALISVVATAAAFPGKGRGMGPDDNFVFLEMIADQIGLTLTQEDSINELINTAQLSSAVDRERMSQIHDELRDLSQADDLFDEGRAAMLTTELGEIIARTSLASAQLRWQVRQVFTEEQRAQIEEMRSRRAGMRSHGRSSDAEF